MTKNLRDPYTFARTPSQFINALERSNAHARALLTCLKSVVSSPLVDPISVHVASSVSRLAKLETTLLAGYALRYAELDTLQLTTVFANRPQHVRQPKTDSNRFLAPWPGYDCNIVNGLDGVCRLRYINYSSLAYEIARAIPLSVREKLNGSAHITHVFRHLRASWMRHMSLPDEEISSFFGHKSPDAIRSYFHDDLFSEITNFL